MALAMPDPFWEIGWIYPVACVRHEPPPKTAQELLAERASERRAAAFGKRALARMQKRFLTKRDR